MTTRSRIIFTVLPILALASGVWWWQQDRAMNPLERWCGDQVRRIADDLLAPKLEFSSLRLQLPATITLADVSLTSDSVAILSMSSMRLECRDIPKRGHPLVIEAATFVEPEVRLIDRPDGALQGFDGFMKSTTGEQYKDGGSSKPSDFLAIRRIAISDGALEWAPTGHEHPLRLTQLDMKLTTSPDSDRPGWYPFKANIERPPVVQLTWGGGISIDTGDLAFDDTTLQVNLSEDKYASLTPSIQDLLRRYSIVGNLTLHTTGHVPLNNAEATDLTFDASLRNAGAAFGDYQFPIDAAEMKATFREMRLAFDPLDVTAFGGQVDSTGSLGLADAMAFSLSITAKDVLLQDMCRPAPGQPPRFAGTIGLELNADGELHDPDPVVNGTGALTIAGASLINVPVAAAVVNEVEGAVGASEARDEGEIDFTFASDRVTIGKSMIRSSLVAARATGDVHYDGRLDLSVNVGAIEKAESLLGGLGDILGALTDRLLPLEVTGTWSEPIVTPAPLGFSLGEARDDAGEK